MSDVDFAAPAEPEAVAALEVAAPEPEAPAFAVLTAPRGALWTGQVVFAAPSAIAALVAAGEAVEASATTVEAAFPFHFQLPEA